MGLPNLLKVIYLNKPRKFLPYIRLPKMFGNQDSGDIESFMDNGIIKINI